MSYKYKPCLDCGKRKEKPHYQGQKWCNACRKIRIKNRSLRWQNALKCWTWMLYHRYKLRPEDYKAMLKKQGGRCAICRGKSKIRLSVDHNHKTHKLRGLLCVKCNTSLGYIEGRKAWMKKAQKYLAKWEGTKWRT